MKWTPGLGINLLVKKGIFPHLKILHFLTKGWILSLVLIYFAISQITLESKC